MLIDAKLSEPATSKQIFWLRAHGVTCNSFLTKIEAGKLISERKLSKAI